MAVGRVGTTASPSSRPARAVTTASLGAVVAAVAVQLLVPGGWGGWAWLPLVAGLLIGLPHGAVDHLLPAHRLGWGRSQMAAFAGGYAALALTTYLVFRTAPGVGLAVFVAVSVWHFGTGETSFADERAHRATTSRWAIGVVLGALVLLVPLARGRLETTAVLDATVPGEPHDLPTAVTDIAIGGTLIAVTLLAGALAVTGRHLELSELAALTALVLLTPPLVAFGVYFGAWHSPRHLSRLLTHDPGTAADVRAGHAVRAARRLAGWALLPTLVVLGAVVVLWRSVDSTTALLVLVLPVIAALTVPHALVVTWMDRHRPA